MTQDGEESSSFIGQIVEKTIDALRAREEFDEAMLTRLVELAKSNDLSNYTSVVDALADMEEA